ncbi:MAG: hypothetical protein JW874_04970 [Spirochaetales bacterium]|nr:hypothetical protein [Spirochaetales bacterium]
MGEYFDQVPAIVQGHIKSIADDMNTPEGEDKLETIAKAWLEKKDVFEEQIEKGGMEEVDSLSADDENGALALTYSGSLINVGPLVDGSRKIGYTSIGFRTELPANAEVDDANLKGDLSVDEIAEFSNGPVQSTSKLFKIAIFKEEMEAEEEEEALDQVLTVIGEGFVAVNKTIVMD